MAYSDDSVFPTTLDSIAGFGEGAANIQTTLSSGISTNPANIPLTSDTGWPTTGGFALIEEGANWVVYKYSGVSGATLTNPSNYAGTQGSFTVAATVKCVLSAGLINKIVDALVKLETKVGIDSSAVATTIDYILKNTTGGHDHDGSDSKLLPNNLITVAQLNSALKSSARAYRNTARNIGNNTTESVILDTENWDTNSEFASNKFTATNAGKYQVNACVTFAANATGARAAVIYVNGAEVCRSQTGNAGANTTSRPVVSDILNLAANDYVELYAYQTSGGDLAVTIGSATTYMSIHRLPS